MLKKIALLVLISIGIQASAQQPDTRILFVLDASGSMYAKMGKDNRITVAKRLLTRLVDSLSTIDDVQLALRVYGHQYPKTERNCTDTRLEVPFNNNNHARIKDEINLIRPMGNTLIAYSLQEAAYDFPKTPGVRNVIILITDGIEECDGDPCAVSEALQKQGVVLRPFIIGLGLSDEFRAQFDCVGRFFEASTEENFKDVLNVVISQAINNTTAQVNLLDTDGRPTETDVVMTFTDSKTGKELYNYYHTLNYRGNPDTLFLDPSYKYDLKVHTMPPIYRKGIELIPGKHNTISLDAPQGHLNLEIEGVTNYKDLKAVVFDKKNGEIINVQEFNDQQKYIVGNYHLEILTLPRITQETVEVVQNKTTTLRVPQPGKMKIVTRKQLEVAIFRYHDGVLEKVKTLNVSQNQIDEVLQPGDYKLIYRETAMKESLNTKDKDFTVKSGVVTHININ